MKRREFIAALGGAAAWPLAIRAEQPKQMRRIGVMRSGDASDPVSQVRVSAFADGLRKLGWIEGTNLAIEYRWGGNDVERVRHYAAELLDQHPEVIWAAGPLSLLSLKRATHTVPIVFTEVVDPVGSGFVASLARPGGNLTGFTLGEFSLGGKMLEVLKEIAPKLNRVAVILNLDQPPNVALYYTIEMLAPSIGIRPTAADVQNPADVERAVQAFASEPNGGLIVLGTPITIAHRELIIALAARHHLPAIYFYRFFVTGGGLVSYSVDPVEQALEGAGYVDRILKGEKPADLPVQAPTKYELVINLKTAKALGLEMPPSVLARADEVIE